MARRFLTFIVLLPLLGVSAFGQVPENTLTHEIPREEIPKYHLVREFLSRADAYLGVFERSRNSGIWPYFLSSIGIKQGSELESRFTEAVLRVRVQRETEEDRQLRSMEISRLAPDEGRQRIKSIALDDARECGEEYRAILESYRDAGASTGNLDAFIEQEIRPTMSVRSDRSFSFQPDFWDVVAAFDSASSFDEQQ